MEMKDDCFPAASWSEFLYGEGKTEQRPEMEKHLNAGCPKCWGVVNLLRKVATVLGYEEDEGPAPLLARSVNSLRRLGRAVSMPLQTAFDSAAAPAPAGVRSAAGPGRQVLYLSDELSLHLQIDLPSRDSSAVVIGQLLRHNGDPEPVADVPTFLSSEDEILAGSVTNRLGEFHLESPLESPLHLSVALSDDACIAVSVDGRSGDDAEPAN